MMTDQADSTQSRTDLEDYFVQCQQSLPSSLFKNVTALIGKCLNQSSRLNENHTE